MSRPRCPNCDVDIRDCKCITLFGDKASNMAVRKAKPKTWSRKGRCPSCNVGSGSKHRSECTFDYGTETSVKLPKKPIISRDGLIDALNRMDEYASAYTVDNSEISEGFGEADQLKQDYEILFDFISNVKIK